MTWDSGRWPFDIDDVQVSVFSRSQSRCAECPGEGEVITPSDLDDSSRLRCFRRTVSLAQIGTHKLKFPGVCLDQFGIACSPLFYSSRQLTVCRNGRKNPMIILAIESKYL